MEQNSNENISTPEVGETAEAAAPVRRRASRRVSAAAGAAAEVAPAAETAAAVSEATAAATTGAEAPVVAEPKKRVSRSRKKADAVDVDATDATGVQAEAAEAPATEAATEPEAPKKRVTRSRKKPADDSAADSAAVDSSTPAVDEQAPAPASDTAADSAEAEAAPAKTTRGGRSRSSAKVSTAKSAADTSENSDDDAAAVEAPATGQGKRGAKADAPADEQEATPAAEEAADGAEPSSEDAGSSSSRRRGRGQGQGQNRTNGRRHGGSDADGEGSSEQPGDAQDSGEQGSNRNDRGERNNRGDNSDSNRDNQSRSSRTRQRDRKRRGQGDDFEHEITEDDVLLPVAGILDVLDNYAFVRTSGYLAGTNDVYVSLGQVKKYNLRKGDAIVGAIRQPHEGEHSGRQKYNAIVKIDTVNGRTVDENQNRTSFADLTPVYPTARLRLETDAANLTQRAIDVITPIGKGQRGLIIGAPKTGKSTLLKHIADAVSKNAPEAHLMVVLIDGRPEDVTEAQRSMNGEVLASTFDHAAEDHLTLADLAIERAKRLVELGHDVVILLDSFTRLGRAYLSAAQGSARAHGGVDVAALYPLKKFFGAARNTENGGTLTVIATALAETGSVLDETILEEFSGATNLEIRLSRELADKQLFPALDVRNSAALREDVLLSRQEAQVSAGLRRSFADLSNEQALSSVIEGLGKTATNVEFLMVAQRTQSKS